MSVKMKFYQENHKKKVTVAGSCKKGLGMKKFGLSEMVKKNLDVIYRIIFWKKKKQKFESFRITQVFIW